MFLLFVRVAKMRPTTSCHNTVVSLLYPGKLDNLEAIRYSFARQIFAWEKLDHLEAIR